jgi:probable rRNA maturation factor
VSIEFANETDFELVEHHYLRLLNFLIKQLELHPKSEVGLVLVSEESIAELNQQWLGEAGPTDVLSFPIDEVAPFGRWLGAEPGVLGDIVLCPSYASRQAAAKGVTAESEFELLVTHGMLHLVGFDHDEPEAEREMFDLQDRLLSEFRLQPELS